MMMLMMLGGVALSGSHLYAPSVDFEDVILPAETKRLVMESVKNYDVYKVVQKNIELDKKISYGNNHNPPHRTATTDGS